MGGSDVCLQKDDIYKVTIPRQIIEIKSYSSSAMHHTRSTYGKQLRNSSLTIKNGRKVSKWKKKNENSTETKRIHQKVPYEQIQDILYVKGWLHKIT